MHIQREPRSRRCDPNQKSYGDCRVQLWRRNNMFTVRRGGSGQWRGLGKTEFKSSVSIYHHSLYSSLLTSCRLHTKCLYLLCRMIYSFCSGKAEFQCNFPVDKIPRLLCVEKRIFQPTRHWLDRRLWLMRARTEMRGRGRIASYEAIELDLL